MYYYTVHYHPMLVLKHTLYHTASIDNFPSIDLTVIGMTFHSLFLLSIFFCFFKEATWPMGLLPMKPLANKQPQKNRTWPELYANSSLEVHKMRTAMARTERVWVWTGICCKLGVYSLLT